MDIAHLTISTRGRFPLFDDPSACRRALHRLTTCRSAGLVLFALADDHAHLVTLEHRTSAARAAARIRQSLGACAGVPLDPPYVRPVETRRHLLWLLEYLLLP